MFASLETISHATIVTGNRAANLAAFKEFLHGQEIETQGNPDFFVFDDEQLLMEDAMSIVEMLTSRKVSAQRFCIISCDRMAHDVQNRLLKTVEEPQPGTHIIFMIPNTDFLLPTVLSRCQIMDGDKSISTSRLDVAEFLGKKLADRFAWVESWTKNKKDEDNISKTELVHFIDALEKALWDSGNRNEVLFADIRKMRDYAHIRGGSHRVILDFLAVVAPVLK